MLSVHMIQGSFCSRTRLDQVKMTFSPGRPSDKSTTACKPFVSPGQRRQLSHTHIFAADLPALLLLIEALRNLVAVGAETNDDIALDRTQTADPWGACGRGHGTDRNVEVGRRGGCTVVSQLKRGSSVCHPKQAAIDPYLAVVEITLENHKVRTREVEEEIRCFVGELPEGEAGAPERVLLIHPLALLLVLL